MPSNANALVSRERLAEVFNFGEDGHFYWRKPNSRAVRVGQLAGRKTATGYRQIMVDNVRYMEHRLVWLWVTGAHPEHEIDHINGVRDGNRPENLRAATKGENQQNIAGARKDNPMGLVGVTRHGAGRWRAQINADGVKYYLGLFATPEAAHEAYLRAKARLHTFQPTLRK